MVEILYVDKMTLYPRFGYYDQRTISIRSDLPEMVQDFILSHELFHSRDIENRWWLREIKANLHAFRKYPFGGLVTAFLSLSPVRLMYYVKRFREGK